MPRLGAFACGEMATQIHPGKSLRVSFGGGSGMGEFEAALYLQAHQQPRNPSSPDRTDSPYTELHPDIQNWILEYYGEAGLPA